MAAQSEFVNYLLELLAPLGAVHARAMFGGHGIYRDDLMFGLVADDTLYLKADDGNRAEFEAEGLPPFTYKKNDREYAMSYYQAPPDALDDSEALCHWARRACEAAVRAAAGKRTKPQRTRGRPRP